MTSYSESTDIMYAVAVAAVKSAESIYGFAPQMLFMNRADDAPPDPSKVWVRIGRTTNQEGQGTLSTCEGSIGAKRYDSFGLVWVQIFAPMADPDSDANAVLFAETIQRAFRNKRSGPVWFMNPTIKEIANANGCIRYNVNAEYDYSDIQ